ncbi:hypothetical protein H0264_14575 [Nocardia huaxiensis]|uniref:Uncharacterized protein n=1 Tax=Nocardia huaxiensis TaxID=2755382 RepID=A0A7D6VEP0_9NOCA|nr:hypothetical protein [Nocardia huaxiensis]QLY33293.1 hypothetical protein H0264_14575 [Nocardia huaxiensis]
MNGPGGQRNWQHSRSSRGRTADTDAGRVMRDSMGAHVSKVNSYGRQQDIDEIFVTTSVQGSFRVHYFESIDRVCVDIQGSPFGGDVSMQLSLDQAMLLRELLDAGIADAIAATKIELSGGAA